MRSERQPNAELLPALPDGIGQDAVNANDGKHKCCSGKAADEQHGEAGLRTRVVDQFFGGLNFIYRLIAVDGSDLGTHGCDCSAGGNICPHQQIHVAPGKLRERQIQLRLRFLLQTLILDIRSHTDNQSGLGPAPNHDLLADCRLAGPVLARKSFVHDDHGRGCGIVGVCKRATTAQRDAHRLEPSRADGFNIDERSLSERHVGLTFRQYGRDALEGQGQGGGDGCRTNSGLRRDTR